MAGVLKDIVGFDKDTLRRSETVVRTLPVVGSDTAEPGAASSWKRTDKGWIQVSGGGRGVASGVECDEPLAGTHAECHGLKGQRSWAAPRLVTFCDSEARVGYDSMKAHEYLDVPEVLAAKTKLLAEMIRSSEATLAYTGAGISTSSGIPDYASRTSNGVVKASATVRSPYEARPTLSHRVLVAMYRAGLLHHWIQQNHDGLPQKAGLPQEAINEIHGAIYDPSNPVVPMSGSLRSDLFEDMNDWTEKTELCLAIGTTMCGMSADAVASDTAERFAESGQGQGTVIVNLQRTTHDYYCSLRIFARVDDVMAQLAVELGLTSETERGFEVDTHLRPLGPSDVFRVPYDDTGRRTSTAVCDRTETSLDLREEARVRICGGRFDGDEGVVSGKQSEGHYKITIHHKGVWFVDAARRGSLEQLPLVNCSNDT